MRWPSGDADGHGDVCGRDDQEAGTVGRRAAAAGGTRRRRAGTQWLERRAVMDREAGGSGAGGWRQHGWVAADGQWTGGGQLMLGRADGQWRQALACGRGRRHYHRNDF
ncbi:hypothetical protein GUJ93_ZPchr0001g31826 [Zizania palustris]|uniref:Uncharacterized protein n=1 Tax=Zizania palustris TaxID=103762 RepID=A0A8J5RN20_ZIZPA|nr:hypothetical protein GUJ93_ZPchr0001g31826 [Zizania palustris]